MLNRLEMLRIFCTAAKLGSFKDAATRLGISPQAVTRAVQELERLQGELLFHRNTRHVQLSEFGAALAERAQLAVEQIDTVFEHGENDDAEEAAGLVRLTAPAALSRTVILPALTAIASRYPKIDIDLRLSDALADVVNEKIDIGVRIGLPRDNRFVVRKVARTQLFVVATPDCIAQHGEPVSFDDLHRLPTTAMYDGSTGRAWPWMFADGQRVYPAGARFMCNDAEAELSAVLAGLAYGQVPDFLAREHLASGRLVAVMRDAEASPWDIYIYRPQRGPLARRFRVVYDALGDALAQLPV
ncbi:LysR family transcriptional regulator [Janthinobacterium sp. Mn2066]|uniref:LysR family transcriptional regulator n=1 Tax=Janthinobacterium sp. Mn2066 TaxID=3395264 RepID=UPI003BE73B2D